MNFAPKTELIDMHRYTLHPANHEQAHSQVNVLLCCVSRSVFNYSRRPVEKLAMEVYRSVRHIKTNIDNNAGSHADEPARTSEHAVARG